MRYIASKSSRSSSVSFSNCPLSIKSEYKLDLLTFRASRRQWGHVCERYETFTSLNLCCPIGTEPFDLCTYCVLRHVAEFVMGVFLRTAFRQRSCCVRDGCVSHYFESFSQDI